MTQARIREEGYASNETSATGCRQNRIVTAGHDKTNQPQLTAGQQTKVNGYFCDRIEDLLYLNMLIVTPNMDEGNSHALQIYDRQTNV